MIVYKFVPAKRATIISELEIAFVAPCLFNDPFEMSPVFESLMRPEDIEPFIERELAEFAAGGDIEWILQKELENARLLIEAHRPDLLVNDMKELREYLAGFAKPLLREMGPKVLGEVLGLSSPETKARFVDNLFERMNQKCRVLSLSASCDNILLWSHYADSHSGLAIGFDADHAFFDQRTSENDPIRVLKKVDYRLNRPEFRGFGQDPRVADTESFADMLLLSKSKVWEYEEEWRMVLTSGDADRSVGENGLVSIFKLPGDLIRSVVFGARMREDTRKIVGKALEIQGLTSVSVYQAMLDTGQYRVNIGPI